MNTNLLELTRPDKNHTKPRARRNLGQINKIQRSRNKEPETKSIRVINRLANVTGKTLHTVYGPLLVTSTTFFSAVNWFGTIAQTPWRQQSGERKTKGDTEWKKKNNNVFCSLPRAGEFNF